ncbi:ABC transporter ATP-binding protein [Propionivibrio sp.]|uniref:ABC transporter ATP-binding protein n=1 Tax=Propionivibrio sp. TaxID=2212460 RepID=UPI0025D3AFED|nr:ABC transporter ATP-binding protein [Propionivibrio sp.]MBK7354875.1 ABC transporter ATP-binding protein [Propionivibrio sp.]MBK8402244.1 ABC transporter ATP-binding protein [Propionivibrio sp.]MBK8745933.1 ABC transporter ATP-binding protein [Propionivibrio sp.]MBK8892700.1 ABC transporter ATP-binding protein [Propionivibrio sp.]MBL0207412.1 ABC transporter ATP-binding protein [Propionivibrio sp.]
MTPRSSKLTWEAALLEVTGLRVAYGGIQAVRGITFHINQGEMVALIGANGAGKTSTLKALSRLLDISGGSVRYCGKELSILPPHQLVSEGIAMVPEGRGVFPRMSIIENLQMGAYVRRDKDGIDADREHVFTLFPRLKERAHQLAGTLSGGEQQMLAIGRALMCRPKLLLLDEPSMGLAPLMVQKIFEVVRAVADKGMTVLLVEQNAKLALEVSQRGYVMESGEITLTDESARLLANPKVREAYLGE